MRVNQQHVLSEQGKHLLLTRYDGTTETIDELCTLLGAPRWRVKRWAQQHGLAKEKERPWQASEDAYLERFYATKSMGQLIHRLERTERAIKHRLLFLGLTKMSEGYTLQGMADAFGCSRERILSWVDRGWLRGERRQTNRPNDIWYFSEAAVRSFVKEYRKEVSRTKPDLVWLIDLLS